MYEHRELGVFPTNTHVNKDVHKINERILMYCKEAFYYLLCFFLRLLHSASDCSVLVNHILKWDSFANIFTPQCNECIVIVERSGFQHLAHCIV